MNELNDKPEAAPSRKRMATHASCLAGLLLAGCATPGSQPIIPAALQLPERQAAASTQERTPESTGLKVQALPAPPLEPAKTAAQDPTPPARGLDSDATSAINLEQIPLASFAQIAFSEVLKKNVSVDPRVLARRDLVTFRTGGPQTAAQIEQAVKLLLKSYGVSALDVGGLVRIVPDDNSGSMFPEIRRGNAAPETPLPLRPIFHLVDIQSVRPADVALWLRTIFGDKIKIQEDPARNAILLSGNTDNVAAALEAVRALDQPVMAGRASLALSPSFWSADDLARRLFEVLTAEGYAVQPLGSAAAAAGNRSPVILLPVTALNSVFVFTTSEALSRHVADWAARLDRPNERGIGKNYFTYAVKHKDAAALAQTLEQLLTGTKPAAGAAAATPATGTAAAAAPRSGAVVVDNASNTLIFQASAEEYTQITALLQSLDKPAKSALIEVTVAELSVDKNSQLGVEWFFNQAVAGGSVASGGTLGGLAIGSAGFNYRVVGSAGGAPRLLLNALASDNKATILSSPRVTARNGESAVIQVGQEVPIVTSQQSTNTASLSGNLGVLQTIQYRSTGVILKVKPAIHSGDQIDLDISQEVSAAQSTSTGVNSSPTISTRKVDTKLTLRNGSTVMLGGLISDESTGGNAGIPLLKEVPVLGNLFSTQTNTGKRRELIVLITPYIISGNQDSEAITEAFRSTLGPWAGRLPRAVGQEGAPSRPAESAPNAPVKAP